MSIAGKNALTRYRRRAKRAGLARLEVQVRKEDAPLVRDLANALSDPKRGPKTRAVLRQQLGAGKPKGLKALLAEAPLEGIEFERPHDLGRNTEL